MVYKSSTGGGNGGTNVSSLNGETGAVNLTSTGNTVVITPAGQNINLEVSTSSVASTTFGLIGGGTNTSAAMVVGSGASLTPSGSGVITATLIAIVDDTTTNATVYPTWVTANTGNLPAKVSSTKFTFNPSTNIMNLGGLSINPANGGVTFGQTFGITISTSNELGLIAGSSDPVSVRNFSGNSVLAFKNNSSVNDLFLRRDAGATLRHGAADAASPVNQIIATQGSRAGTDTNTSGANLTINSGIGTGNAPGSSIIFQAPVAVASGTATQTITTIFTIAGSGVTSTTAAIGGATLGANSLAVSGNILFNNDLVGTAGGGFRIPTFVDINQSQGVGVIVNSGRYIGWSNSTSTFTTQDTILSRPAAATIQHGAADADTNALIAAQTIRSQGLSAGGTADQAGKNLTIIVSPGKGTGAGGSFIVQTAPAGSTGTVVGTPTTALTIDSTKLSTFAGAVNFPGSTGIDSGGALSMGTNNINKVGPIRFGNSNDTILSAPSAAILHLGAADSASPIAQTLGVQGVVAGTLNVAGAAFSIAGSVGTGTGIGGPLLFKVAPAGLTGSTQNPLSTALTIDSTLAATFVGSVTAATLGGTLTTAAQPNITSVGTLTGGSTGTGFTVALGSSTITGQLPLANGGTGANLVDPNADRILFWDDSAGQVTFLTAGSGLSITNTTIASTATLSIVQQVVTATGTYTPTSGMVYCIVEAVGSGAGGGGATSSIGTSSGGGAGGSGGYSRVRLTAAQVGSSQTVTISAAGVGGANGGGANGGTVSVGSLCVALGGTGGVAGTAGGAGGTGGAGGAAGTGDFTAVGNSGGDGIGGTIITFRSAGGCGAPSYFGGGVAAVTAAPASTTNTAGNNAANYGAGGGGGVSMGSITGAAGGTGSNGVVIITEFCS